MAFMQKNEIYNVEHAYKAMVYEDALKAAQFEASKKTSENIQQNHKGGIVAKPSNGKPVAAPASIKGKSYDQIAEMALAEFGIKN
jgi:hypothetical protein